MTQYYFDLETTGFDSANDKIITIQYQELDWEGKARGELTILKEWESSEEEIVKKFYNILNFQDNWRFIPFGTNLIFDLTFLFAKFKKYSLQCPSLSDYLYSKPQIDIKYLLVMLNNLQFKGAGLDKFTSKKTDGRLIPQLYIRKEYLAIENYILDESQAFLQFFEKCQLHLKNLA